MVTKNLLLVGVLLLFASCAADSSGGEPPDEQRFVFLEFSADEVGGTMPLQYALDPEMLFDVSAIIDVGRHGC